MNAIPVTLCLPRDLVARLDAAAASDDRSRSAIARRIFADALSDHAALQREAARRFVAMHSTAPGSLLPAAPLVGASGAVSRHAAGGAAAAFPATIKEQSMHDETKEEAVARHEANKRAAYESARAADADARARAFRDPHQRPTERTWGDPTANAPAGQR